MATAYQQLVDQLTTYEWSVDAVDVNIPDHPEYRINSPSGRYQVELSPVNGYDDGTLHEDRLRFFVNVHIYRVAENGDKVEQESPTFSRRVDTADAAVDLAQQKLDEYNQHADA